MDRAGLIAHWSSFIRSFSYAPDDAKRYALRLSSGTSGAGAMMSLSERGEALKQWYAGEGRVALCFGTRAVRLYNLLGSLEAGLSALALDGTDLTPERLALVAQFKPTRLHGFPSFVLRVASQLPAEVRAQVLELRLVGELITDSMEAAFRELLPNAQMRTIYAASEVGAITQSSCGHLPRNHYHPQSGVVVSVDEPDEAGAGDVVVSKRLGAQRIDSYRTGDLGRLYECACPCGERVALEMLGRAGADYLKLAGGTLRVEEFDRALAGRRPLIEDYRVEATTLFEGGTPKGKVRVVLYAPEAPTDALRQEIAEALARAVHATPTRTLAQLAAQGLFAPVEVAFAREPFPRTHKVVRMRYIP